MALGWLSAGVLAGKEDGPAWRLSEKPMGIITGLDVPESVCVDAETGFAYVSNITTATEGYWEDDGQAFLTRLKPDGTVDALRWRTSTAEKPLHAPKGLCILDGVLYVADNTRVCCYPLKEGKAGPHQIKIAGAKQLNDLATDGKSVYVSDTGASQIVRLDLSGQGNHMRIPAPDMVNGITFHQGRMFGVSWTQHEVYELDPQGRKAPRPLGVAEHFTNPDGIEVLDDGHLLVSDFNGRKIVLIAPDGRRVWTLATLDCPADIGLDRKGNRLFVPQFFKKQVQVFRIEGREEKKGEGREGA